MTIATQAQLDAAARQVIHYTKVISNNSNTALWQTLYDASSGEPGGGTLALAITASGAVPVSGAAGFPTINPFGASAKGYIAGIDVDGAPTNSGAVYILYDRLFHAGGFTFGAATYTLGSQPSFSSRVPGGTDYSGLEIWAEGVATSTGNPTFAITYTDQSGNAGQSTPSYAFGSILNIRQMCRIPLAAGDCGVQKIESVTSTVASVGTFNIIVARPLAMFRMGRGVGKKRFSYMDFGLPEVFADSALCVVRRNDSGGGYLPGMQIALING